MRTRFSADVECSHHCVAAPLYLRSGHGTPPPTCVSRVDEHHNLGHIVVIIEVKGYQREGCVSLNGD